MADLSTLKSLEFLKASTKEFEKELSGFVSDSQIEYLRGWAFELASREVEMNGIEKKGIRYDCIQALRRCQAMSLLYDSVLDAVGKNNGQELHLEVELPRYEEIDNLLKQSRQSG